LTILLKIDCSRLMKLIGDRILIFDKSPSLSGLVYGYRILGFS
jgi:hypothetical protein